MKTLFLLLSSFVLTTVMAQDTASSDKSGIERLAALQLQQLQQRITNLNAEQTSSLQTVFAEFGNALADVKKEKQRRVKMELFQMAEKRKDKAIHKILNKEQLKIYEELKEEWKEKMQQQRRSKGRINQ
jgi:CHASE1-domain containing sensor protein